MLLLANPSLQAPLRMLAITLPLGLSKDDSAPSVVAVSVYVIA